MEYEIYEEPNPEKKKVRLKLVSEEGRIDVIAVDENGEMLHHGRLISFNEDGYITRFGFVNEELEFELDKDGKIMVGRD